jgi:putative flavoprotein involved in K+ transport
MASAHRTERYELVVIGGGQAGLAVAYWLARHDIDFLVVDAHARTGDSWRNRWNSLKLFTPARYSGLPGVAFPGDPYHFPTRDDVADYLEWYAKVFALPVRHGVRVSQVRRAQHGFEITTDGTTLEADNVIVASGPHHVPRVPAFAAQLDPAIVQLHSSAYRGPAQLPDGPTLVVGAGNSGAQIALELAQSRDVFLSGRSVGAMPRRFLGRDIFDWLWRTLMIPGADSLVGRRIRANVLGSSDALIGMTEADLRVPNITRVGRVISVDNGVPALATGAPGPVSSIIWCTGFGPDYSWIDVPVFGDDGFPSHARGVTRVPGLYFLGLRFLYRLNSSLIGGVGADAEFIANAVVARYGRTKGQPLRSIVRPAAEII